jgi:hypothetical protein
VIIILDERKGTYPTGSADFQKLLTDGDYVISIKDDGVFVVKEGSNIDVVILEAPSEAHESGIKAKREAIAREHHKGETEASLPALVKAEAVWEGLKEDDRDTYTDF